MKALYAGSFDPFTIGHLSIVKRGLQLFDKMTIGIGINESKKGEWTPQQREAVIRKLFADEPRVEVRTYSGLTVDFARNNGNDVLLRGARNAIDFEAERTMADANMALAQIDTVILTTSPELAYISSSLVRELLHHGHDISSLVAGNWTSVK